MTRRSFTVFHFLLFLGLRLTSGATVRNGVVYNNEDDEVADVMIENYEVPEYRDRVAPAVPTTYPYFTLVKYFFAKGQSGSCGGSLIAPDVVLTAAKCVSARSSARLGPPVSVEVWVNSTSPDYSEYDYFRKAIRWVIHPGFNEFGFANDIALLFLDTPVVGVPLALLHRDDALPDDGSRMKVLANTRPRTNNGFGQFSRAVTRNAPSALQAPVNTLPVHACWKAFGAENFKESLLCASDHGLRGGITGGPLLIASSSVTEDVQVGIAICGASRDSAYSSYSLDGYQGHGTDMNSNVPKGYTRVSHFVEWIDARICQFSASKPSNCQTKALKAVG